MFKLVINVELGPLTKELVAKMQRETCRRHKGKTPKGSKAAELQALKHRMSSSVFIVDSPESYALVQKLQEKPISSGSIRRVLTSHGKKVKGNVKRNSFAAKLQSVADRVKLHKERGEVASIELKVLEKYPVSLERASQVQSEIQREVGFVGKESLAAKLQSAAQKTENVEGRTFGASLKLGGKRKVKSRSLIDSDEESDDILPLAPPRFR